MTTDTITEIDPTTSILETDDVREIALHEDMNNFFFRCPNKTYDVDPDGKQTEEKYGMRGSYQLHLSVVNEYIDKTNRQIFEEQEESTGRRSELYLSMTPRQFCKVVDDVITGLDRASQEEGRHPLVSRIYELQDAIARARGEYRFNDVKELQQKLNEVIRPVYVEMRARGFSREDLAL